MTAGNGSQSSFRLKAKEKILVQLYLHRCEPDVGPFPFEVTQKGLSDHLGLRRSHVAVALQELVKDGLVEVVKGHVEGEDRRQNAYCITPKGVDDATSVRERLLEVQVSFEDSSGIRTVKISEIVTSRKASLASVISQMDRGGPVRDEIAVVTKPEKKQVSVFCPTCKKQIEVDNIFTEEEVGFDCPGCGRPYRIVPATRAEAAPEEPEISDARKMPAETVAIILAALAVMTLSFFALPTCLSTIVLALAGIGIVIWLLAKRRRRTGLRPRTRLSAVTYTVVLSPFLLFIWHFRVASIDPGHTLEVLAPILVSLSLAYLAVRLYLPEFRGDYLMSSGLVLILVAAATMVLEEFGEIDVGMAMIVGISGAVFVVLSTFHPMDKDAVVLDIAMAVGAFLLLMVGIVLFWESSETIDYIAAEALAILGMVLIAFRIARERTDVKDLSSHLVAAIPLTLALGLVVMGVFLLQGGAAVAGVIELATAVPFAYFGSKQVFNEHWPYRVPIVVFFIAVLILAVTAGLLT